MSLRIALTSLSAALLLMACQDNGTGPTVEEKKAFLVGKNWVAESRTLSPGFKMDPSAPAVTDYFMLSGACQKDDIRRFSAQGRYTLDAGAERCMGEGFGGSPDGNWIQSADGKSIILDLDSDSDSTLWTVEQLTATSLKVSYASPAVFGDGSKQRETLVLKAR